ncbi:MAG TPA: hypothetical protein VF980_09090 [Thermoanaerobaculia bacterium]
MIEVVIACVFVIAITLRVIGSREIPPADDAYHLKRIEYSAAHFPAALEFDPDRGERGAFCPWPPLYDVALGAVRGSGFGIRALMLIPPLFFATFAAIVAFAFRRFGLLPAATAGLTLAFSPYLIVISSVGHLDHHYVEPLLLLLIVAAAMRRNGIALGIAITLALFVQTALFVAAGIAFVAMFFSDKPREGAKAFAIAAAAILLFRLTRPPAYPDSAWFLGYAHAALLAGAAVACALRERVSAVTALAAGVGVALAVPQTGSAFFSGLHFFGGDPWLSSIAEFQPMFRNAGQIGTDIANLTGGAVLSLFLWRRYPTFALFATTYLALAISSRRFLVPAIALFAVGGALAAARLEIRDSRFAWAALLMTVLPPLAYDLYSIREGEPSMSEYRALALCVRPLPAGRVLAPWSFGHAIDVIGQHAVVIDNFGSMPDERVFTNAIEAMLLLREKQLLRYCRDRQIRYLVLPHPAYIPSAAATIGIDRDLYSRTRLARRTVWSRLYGGELIGGFELVSRGALSIWKIE